MRRSSDHILTSQAGSLPRPDDLRELNRRRQAGEALDEAEFQEKLHDSVEELVERQVSVGVDVVGDGEFGKAMGQKVDYGAWRSYVWQRLSGVRAEVVQISELPRHRSTPGHIVLSSNVDRRDRLRFAEAYADPTSGTQTTAGTFLQSTCVGPISYTGQQAIAADIENFKSALGKVGVEEGFMTSVGPASCARVENEHYASDEELLYACADAMRVEYEAIIDAGIVLQIDDPAIAENFDLINPEPSIEDYQRFTMTRVEALNHALRGLPKDRIRFHLCWGSWHGPHTTDIPMRDIVDVLLAVDADGYSFEAGNVRHEHEWKVWRDVKLPEGKVILPGVVSHATNVIEHPEVVADRILRYAGVVGRENVIASTDCGLGGRIHPQLAWAKLEALAEGAALATRELWR
jgi:5-methyltetrahydropteroyltriglutamate--homocysteine methyltransferase